MFAVHCPSHGSRVLIFNSGVERVRNTERGIEVDYRCSCGQRGTWLTGRATRRREEAAQRSTRGAATSGAEYAVLTSMTGAGGGLA